jgi:hypothetical protein
MARSSWLRFCIICWLAGLAAGEGPDFAENLPEEVADEPPVSSTDREHWAFVPVRRPGLPPVRDANWCRSPIDRFILARLEAVDLHPVRGADETTLLRRITFNLTGLPPTTDEIDRYLTDDQPGAYERVVDRLLASPAYGERWGMHWLDLARFAETDGFEHDKVRPEAWRYRDWVIAALNSDLPYDRFVQLQLAADQVDSADRFAQLATGFLLAGPDMPDINLQPERRHVFLNGMTANVGEVCLGLQFGCAQCHDHKTDPISQRDFYRLRACFEEIDLFREPTIELDSPMSLEVKAIPVRVTQSLSRVKEPSRLWVRGDFRRPGPEVQPGVLRAAVPIESAFELQDAQSDRRRQLSAWITSPKNPLTARVIVNRLWQQHFGVGLVATPSDFGYLGSAPTHPELLDWLATELIRQDWSLKAIQRMLVTSATYRTASRPEASGDPAKSESELHWPALVAADPANKLLGRMRRRRLEGEAIRDAMLAATGALNVELGGPGVRPPLPTEVVKMLLKDQWPVTAERSQHDRRSIYLFVRRNLKYPLFDVFDRPDQNLSCSRRMTTTIAPQALAMLNSEFAHVCGTAAADRLAADAGPLLHKRVETAYLTLLGRPPTTDELSKAAALVASGPEGWTDFCVALLNTSEFVYID